MHTYQLPEFSIYEKTFAFTHVATNNCPLERSTTEGSIFTYMYKQDLTTKKQGIQLSK